MAWPDLPVDSAFVGPQGFQKHAQLARFLRIPGDPVVQLTRILLQIEKLALDVVARFGVGGCGLGWSWAGFQIFPLPLPDGQSTSLLDQDGSSGFVLPH